MRKLFITALFVTACVPTREITRERIVQYDTVFVEIYRAPVERTADVMLFDSLVLDLPEVKLELIRLPKADTTHRGDSIRVNVTVKEDTLSVPVVNKTVTEKTKEVREKRVMAWWGWVTIGVLLVLLVAALLK